MTKLNIKKQSVSINELVYDSCSEQSIECDVILPDYCPDIDRVLKCCTQVKITSKQLLGTKLNIEGMCYAKIFYVYGENKVHCHKCKSPFSKSVDIKAEVKSPIIRTTTQVDYVNCRVISQRRLEIRGASTIGINIISCCKEDVVRDTENGCIQLKKCVCTQTPINGQKSENFSVKEQVDIGYSKSPIYKIICSRSVAKLGDFKTISGKLVTKGELCVSLMFYTDEQESCIEQTECSIPISQLIDVQGVDESYTCAVSYEVLSCEASMDDLDECRDKISVQAEICCTVVYHKNTEIVYAKDCYSTKYKLEFTKKMLPIMNLVSVIKDCHIHKNTTEIPEDVNEILNVWSKCKGVEYSYSKGILKVMSDMNICILCRTNSCEIKYLEKTDRVVYEINAPVGEKDNVQAFIDITNISACANILGTNKVEYRCDLLMEGCIYKSCKLEALTDITLKEEKETEDKNCSLIVYFAEKGEPIWDIAKRYNTSLEAVIAENNISGEILEKRTMLLIPII